MRQVLTATEEIIPYGIAACDQEKGGFDGENNQLTAGHSQKHRSVDVEHPWKPFRIDNKFESMKKLFGHNQM